MRCAPRPESLAIFVALCLLAPGPARAEDRVLVQGLADWEIWRTNDDSELLSRNEGRAASLGRLRLWMAVPFGERLQAFALGEVEGGKASDTGETEVDLGSGIAD